MGRTLTALAAGCLISGLILGTGRAEAADPIGRHSYRGELPPCENPHDVAPSPRRYFPREGVEGDAVAIAVVPPCRVARTCRPRGVPIPTNAPDDPSYVGSTYGLSKPSYYGFVPALGIDDPFGRSVLPYCR